MQLFHDSFEWRTRLSIICSTLFQRVYLCRQKKKKNRHNIYEFLLHFYYYNIRCCTKCTYLQIRYNMFFISVMYISFKLKSILIDYMHSL